MTTYRGVVGALARLGRQVPFGVNRGYLSCFAKDFIALPGAAVAADRISLGVVRSDAYLDADLSKITFDDMGTSVTIDIGADPTVPVVKDALNGNTIALLTDNLDVSTAAGSATLLGSVTTANRHKPLWQMLNFDYDPQCEIELFATFAGDPGAGNLSWKIIGS